MSNVNNIVEITIGDNRGNDEVVKLPMLPKVIASNIERCHLLLTKFPFNRGIFEDLSCYIVNPEYLAWTVKLRLPVDGEVVADSGSSGFVPPTQLVYADVLRNYMEKIVPLNFAVGDITIELRFVSNQEMRLWCVDFVMEPVVRNDLPMPPALPHIQCERSKPSNASYSKPSNQAKKFYTASANNFMNPLPLPFMYPSFPVGNDINQLVQSMASKKRKRKR